MAHVSIFLEVKGSFPGRIENVEILPRLSMRSFSTGALFPFRKDLLILGHLFTGMTQAQIQYPSDGVSTFSPTRRRLNISAHELSPTMEMCLMHSKAWLRK
jgi:hypothetical protein